MSVGRGGILWLVVILLLSGLHAHASTVEHESLMLWFDRPSADWERESLPIGNGAMGAAVQGGVDRDVIQFNEKTLWTGGPGSTEGYDFGVPDESLTGELRAVRKELRAKGAMTPEAVAERLGRPMKGYGHYQNFGEIVLEFAPSKDVRDYRRELNIQRGVSRVSYRDQGIR
ncbi:MAG TPA: glycoside hydrolase N-terminal domain-containing protein, partial [Gammaproteobacteria bacterium]